MTPNTTSLASVATACVKWTLMGLATFVATHQSCFTTFGLIKKCVAPKSKRHNTPLIPTLNLSGIKLGPNLAILSFVTNPLMPNFDLPFRSHWQSAPILHNWNTELWQHPVVFFLSEFPCPWACFYPTSFFGPSCVVLSIFTLVVKWEISGIPTFLCTESSSMHFATFIISW
jgi:hypothetical protein